MTDPHDIEAMLTDHMEDATRDLVADAALQRRLLDAAAAGPRAPLSGRAVHALRFRPTWALPAAAALITALAVGGVTAGRYLASDTPVEAGSGAVGSSTPPAPSSAPVAPSSTETTTVAPSSQPRPPATSSRPTASHVIAPPPLSTSVAPPRPTYTTGTSTAPSHSTPPTTSAPPPPVPATCTEPDRGTVPETTEKAFIDYIVGNWLVCSHPTTFGGQEDGLQISRNGHWAKLTRNAHGRLVAGTSSRTEGTWQVIDTSAMNGRTTFQLNLKIDGSGTVTTDPELSAGVTRMRLDNNGVYVADYVPTSDPVS